METSTSQDLKNLAGSIPARSINSYINRRKGMKFDGLNAASHRDRGFESRHIQ